MERGEAFEKGKGLCREQVLGQGMKSRGRARRMGEGGAKFEEIIKRLIRASLENSRCCCIGRSPEQVKETMGN